MPLNPNIPLSVKGAQPFNALLAGHQARQQQEMGVKRNQLLDLQTSGQQINNDRAAAENDIRSSYEGALGLVNILGQEGEVTPDRLDNARSYMQNRISAIEARGGNIEGSRRALALLEQGGIDELRQAPARVQDIMVKAGLLQAPADNSFTLGVNQRRFDGNNNLVATGPEKSSGTGLAVDDFIGTPVRVERDGKTFLAGMVQTPDGGFEVREVGLNGELTDTSGRTAQEQVDAKTREAAVKQAIAQSGKAFDRLEGINTNIANLNEVVRLVDNGANTGVWASKLPTIRKASIELKNLQNRLGIDVIGAVTFGALSKGELDLATDTALPTDLEEDDLAAWAKTKIKAQEKLRDSIEEFASFIGSGDKTIAEWIAFKKEQQSQSAEVTSQEEFDALPSGATFIEDGKPYRKP